MNGSVSIDRQASVHDELLGRIAKKLYLRIAIGTLIASMALATTVTNAGDWEDAEAAYDAGHFEHAIELFRKLATEQHTGAQNYLGVMYSTGRGVAKDDTVAFKWFRRAAEQGYTKAQFNLALRFQYGRGVEKDEAIALEWYIRAAEQGHADAQNNLGLMYYLGIGTGKDSAQAFHWLSKAAEQDNAPAQHTLGLMYFLGEGVSTDKKSAFEWLRLAAEKDHAGAQRAIGLMYFDGEGVAIDKTKGFLWTRKAANNGNADAQFDLGRMYETGNGIHRNIAKAHEWYKQAAEHGHAQAKAQIQPTRTNETLEVKAKRTLLQVVWDLGVVDKAKAEIERELGEDPFALIRLPKVTNWAKGMTSPSMSEVMLIVPDWWVLDGSGIRHGAFLSVFCDQGSLFLDLVRVLDLVESEGKAVVEWAFDGEQFAKSEWTQKDTFVLPGNDFPHDAFVRRLAKAKYLVLKVRGHAGLESQVNQPAIQPSGLAIIPVSLSDEKSALTELISSCSRTAN